MEELKGRFHAHITVSSSFKAGFKCPKGWKVTIITLKRESREQTDVMITRHFSVPSQRNPDLESCEEELMGAVYGLMESGYEVTRYKLEHESLPTLPVSRKNYRECHIKVRKPLGKELHQIVGFVESRNPMEVGEDYEVVFMNARFYEGSIDMIDREVSRRLKMFQHLNQFNNITILEIKTESTIFDSNHGLDKWWA